MVVVKDWRTDRLAGCNSDGTVEVKLKIDPDLFSRTPYKQDIDRIKQSREFRRLKDVAQVAWSGESYLHHDRMSHSLKVAQVGRRMAEFLLQRSVEAALENGEETPTLENSQCLVEEKHLDKIDEDLRRQLKPDAVEAACLAHDMGHPPFGHIAEEELDIILQDKTNDYFDRSDPEFPQHYEPEPEESGATDIINADDQTSENCGKRPSGLRFEGNAQAFRILTRLGQHENSDAGFGLTLATLNGVLKYPYGRGEWINHESTEVEGGRIHEDYSCGKFGFYETERKIFEKIRGGFGLGNNRSLTAEIMDYIDDLTYAIHDMIDFYKDGKLPLDRLLQEPLIEEDVERREINKLEEELGYDDDAITTPKDVIKDLSVKTHTIADPILTPYEGTREQRDALNALASWLMKNYINESYVEDVPSDGGQYMTLEKYDDKYHLVISDKLKKNIDILQELTWYYVIEDSALSAQQYGQRKVIRELFESLYMDCETDEVDSSALPESQSELLEAVMNDKTLNGGTDWRQVVGEMDPGECKARVVADFIASLTEPQAIDLHRRLTGSSPGSLQNRIVR